MRDKLIIFMVVVLLTLCGCEIKHESVSESTIFINKDGTIKSVVVEPFDEDIYKIDELRQMIHDDVANYQNDHDSGDVKLISCEVANNEVSVIMTFNSAKDYAEFNDRDFYFGTVSAAIDAGYAKSATLNNAHGNNTVTGSLINDLGTYHMLVFDEDVIVKTYASVLYYSGNLDIIDDNVVHREEGTKGLSYLIIK